MTNLLTKHYKKYLSNQVIESVSETSNTELYLFLGEHVDRTTNVIPTPVDDIREVYVDAYRNMICGKRLGESDLSLMVRNVPYTSGKAFAMYDDNDSTLFTKDFFCVVNAGANYHIYKCLDNNMGANSTVEPNFSHISGANTSVYQTSDGYRWKYLYTLSSTVYDKFSTTNYIPFVANNDVVGNAISGKVEIIRIQEAGKNYGNYGNGTFGSASIRVGGDPLVYEISNSSAVSTVNGFYTGSVIYLTSGTGAGQYRLIDDYYTNANGNFIQVNSAFTVSPTNGTTYDINPYVRVTGDGQQIANAEGRALINALSTNSIYRIEMFSTGNGYSYATAEVVANATVGVSSEAELVPIYPPHSGHGYDAAAELGCEHYGISVTLSNTESNTIPELNTFQKYGLLKDPLFSNVEITHAGADGLFVAGEPVYMVSPIQIATNGTINTTSTSLVAASAKFANQVAAGDVLYLEASNGTSQMLAHVSSVTNSSHIAMTVNGYFSCTEVLVHLANVTASGYVNSVTNTTSMLLSNVSGIMGAGDVYVGNTSGAKLSISSVSRNDVTKTFDTFVQMHKYTGTITSGSFQQDELVYQTNVATANGFLHSTNTDGVTTFYVSNQVGDFSTSKSLVGNTSAATASITAKFSPELVFGSGEILYLENVPEDTARQNTQTFKLIIQV